MIAEQALLRIVAQTAVLRLTAAHDQPLGAAREAASVRAEARHTVLAELGRGARRLQIAIALDALAARRRQDHVAIAHVQRIVGLVGRAVDVRAELAGSVVDVASLAVGAVADDAGAVHHTGQAHRIEAAGCNGRAWLDS